MEDQPPGQFDPGAEEAKRAPSMPPMGQPYRGATQMQTMPQLAMMQDCLAKISAELNSITQGLEGDLTARAEKYPNGCSSYNTYTSLYRCSITLQQMAATVSQAHSSALYINHMTLNSNTFFRPSNFGYPPPGYYGPPGSGNN